jgi:TolB-like protein/Tfp pilus assembly protein PilF
MASLLPGYEYDIFISYRQKDNRHDHWVTEFVDHLRDELESTSKENISIYFDENPHDGLLETHDVDASLKAKLKCLIFIPIISRTYCDPKSFAWEHEFKAFVEMASNDQFGLKVKLPNGNVSIRVLPVRIYDIHAEDINQCELILGNVLRGIEFIYREPGVNRPLQPLDDESPGLNKSKYRNQINKTANSINELIAAMVAIKSEFIKDDIIVNPEFKNVQKKKSKLKYFTGIVIFSILIIAGGYLLLPKLILSKKITEKSIAVLPFNNMSNDPEQEYFCDGIMQEILNNLYMIGGLNIPSSTSSMRFRNSKLSVKEIARQLNVKYLLEGFVTRSDKHVRIVVRLIDGKTEKLKWTEPYNLDITATDLLNLQSEVAKEVAKNMNIVIESSIEKRISHKPTENSQAYDLFQRARKLSFIGDSKSLLEKAISLDPNYSDAYVGLAFYYIYGGGHEGIISRDDVLSKAEPLLDRALALNRNSVNVHVGYAILKLYYYWDFKAVDKEYNIIHELSPSNPNYIDWSVDYLLASGRSIEALNIEQKAFELNQNSTDSWIAMALTLSYNDQPENAYNALINAWKIKPDNYDFLLLNTLRIFNYIGRYSEAIDFANKKCFKDKPSHQIPYFLSHIGVAAYKTGDKIRSDSCLKKLIKKCDGTSTGSPYFFTAALYTAMDNKDIAINMLEKAYTNREVEMYWLKVEPMFLPLHGDPRFETILSKIGFSENPQ